MERGSGLGDINPADMISDLFRVWISFFCCNLSVDDKEWSQIFGDSCEIASCIQGRKGIIDDFN